MRAVRVKGGGYTEYRKREDSDTWHWCRNCSNWPRLRPYVVQKRRRRPSSGELCNQCGAKEDNDNCRT